MTSNKGDTISREALMQVLFSELANVPQPDTDADYYIGVKQGLKLAETIVNNAPTVELLLGRMTNGVIIPIKRPQGEWVVKSNGTTNYYACDKCGSAGDIQDKFCRECGADMRKGGAI